MVEMAMKDFILCWKRAIVAEFFILAEMLILLHAYPHPECIFFYSGNRAAIHDIFSGVCNS
jgi:hypothetical protein